MLNGYKTIIGVSLLGVAACGFVTAGALFFSSTISARETASLLMLSGGLALTGFAVSLLGLYMRAREIFYTGGHLLKKRPFDGKGQMMGIR